MPNTYILNQQPGATAYGAATSLLAEMLVGAGWTYQSSGDGLSGFSSSGKIFTGTGSGALGWGNTHSWARMQDPSATREFVLQQSNNGGARIKYSPSAKFTGSSPFVTAAASAPSATDEKFLRGGTQTLTVTITNASPAVVTWTAHGLLLNSPVVFTVSAGGALPTGLTAGTTYYVSNVLNANTFRVSATVGGADINTSSAGSGTFTGTAPSYGAAWYQVGVAVTSISNASPAVVTLAGHGLAINSTIVFSTTGTLPTGITAGTTYFILTAGFSTSTFQISLTQGGTAINTSSAGSGTHTITPFPTFYGAALSAAPYGFWFAGSAGGSVIKTGLMFDPVTTPVDDVDPYVLHIGSAYVASGSGAYAIGTSATPGSFGRDGGTVGGATTWAITSGGTTEGCFAVMDVSRTSFSYVQPAGYAAQATSQATGLVISGTGLAANPFNGKQDLMPMLYMRLQQSTTTVIPGIKGWSTLGRWTTVSRNTLLDTLSSLTWICVGAMWLPWDGTTTPLG